ncbi:DHA2 family efflux MFS transporter permease subunit [Micromonospora sp. NPDC049101]|uniref:DHA2 family efflux MFS transporter permease subunit n=1 Tax=unclassified Micromonospora TaxID=2617518 RepID=UPI0033F4D384
MTAQKQSDSPSGSPAAATAVRPPTTRQWLTLAVLTIAQLTAWLDNTILNVALKTLADPVAGLGATTSQLQWSISSYTLVFAGLLFTGGVLGDRFGHRRLFLFGMAFFGVSSAWAAYSADTTQLIVARGAMGIGSALIMPATLALVARVFIGGHRAVAIGVFSAASGLAVAAGPLVGGALLEQFWWGSIFLINVPFAIAAIVGALWLVPKAESSRQQRFDPLGVLLSTVGIFILVYGVIEGGHRNEWTQPHVLGPILGGVVLLTAFVFVELRVPHPCFDVRLFRNRHFTGASVSVMLTFFGLAGAMYYSNFYLQGARGYSPLESGAAIAPVAIGVVLGAPLSVRLVQRFGLRPVVALAMLLAVSTFFGFVFFTLETPIIWFCVLMVAQGLGMGAVMAPTTEAIMATLPPERTGAGSAANNSMRQVGSALGVAVLGSVLSGVYQDEVAPSLDVLPTQAQEAAGASAEATRLAAQSYNLPQLVDQANDAFITSMHTTSIVAGAVSFLGVVAILVFLGRTTTGSAR